MRNINVVHGNPEKAGRHLPNQLAHDVERQLIGTGERRGMRFKIGGRKLKNHLQLMQFEFFICQFRRVIGILVVVAQQVLVVCASVGHRGFQ